MAKIIYPSNNTDTQSIIPTTTNINNTVSVTKTNSVINTRNNTVFSTENTITNANYTINDINDKNSTNTIVPSMFHLTQLKLLIHF
ncbi:hypothetical protein BCR36DRAFT_582310 [Piromyces finnis]|uniref:Uncharacterized protein n=1 Tax=Piromyces finnis TaxID=1754191 RepID=A0A1Y1VCQ7_9FUNG|nr:hypothetical protein BCR36DRAFT_582310 [Piromyces finnis]|eukprot:ORX52898.1 hypothetical protein BCR36DRAFT_582310 [Piromyces finnis]